MKVNFTLSLEFENREELVANIIDSLRDAFNPEELDSSYEDFDVPENWKDPSTWTDYAIKKFLTYAGGQFIEDNYGDELPDLLNDSVYEHHVTITD